MRRFLPTVAILVWACSTPSLQATKDDPDQVDSSTGADSGAELNVNELPPEVFIGDGSENDGAFLECEPGTGCFLDPCDANDDCLEGWCVEHMGDSVCTQLCQEECPPGWLCKQAGTGSPDLAWICVSSHAHLCKPCVDAADCQGVGGTEDVCLDYGEKGSFCGGLCGSNDECPWGFSCLETETVDGVTVLQCLADAGECPCTHKSVALGLFTTCELSNEFGTCHGKRVCDKEGLLPCDAAQPTLEICNGFDDDCDGDVDEPYDISVDPPIGICDDGNGCTVDSCKAEEGCQHVLSEEGECLDNDACTIGDHCEAGECVGLPIACDDSNPCTDDICDGLGGCTGDFNMDDCDDGDPCTVNDRCEAGECSGFAVNCECSTDEDCLVFDDGDACTGTLYCEKSGVPFQCQLVPESVVECVLPDDAQPICQAAECDPATGGCALVPANNGYACSDGDACTIGESCLDGACTGGVAPICNDDNPCTIDGCDAQLGCQYSDVAGSCSDGNVCTVGDSCSGGECVAGAELLDCDDSNMCTQDSCDELLGCVHEGLDGVPCSDGNECTIGDSCVGGVCHFSGDLDCDDNNSCTTDTCAAANGCIHTFNQQVCSDGDACTAGDHCVDGKCQAGEPLDCDDGNNCTTEACDPVQGCLFKALDGVPCDDGNACTGGDVCAQGECVFAGDVDCDDGNGCTSDSCSSATGCVHTNHNLPCDDENSCTVGDQCAAGVCTPTAPTDCDDQNACTVDNCDPSEGCVHKGIDGEACDDGDACTTGELCVGGECAGSAPLDCDDDNPCTDDACLPQSGCVHTLNKAACDDGDLCTTGDHCQLGECLSSAPLHCEDGNPCTEDGCEPAAGCTFKPIKGDCDDGNACTLNEQCQNGFCTASGWLECGDGNPCTNDLCDPLQGCLNQNNADPCDDGNPCTANDACFEGNCKPGGPTLCNDGNGCTDDSCDPQVGCVNKNNTIACDDGDVCTSNDKCSAGACVPGPQLICNDGNVCTDDSCDAQLACIYVANDGPCSDDDNCTKNDEDQCVAGECVGGPALDCDDSNPCTVDTCSPANACEHEKLADSTDCGGGKICWKGECVSCGDLTGSETFNYNGAAQDFTVPACISKVTVEAWGAAGGNAIIGVVVGGKGGYAKGDLTVAPGETLKVYVGGQGANSQTGGWNGGGKGGAKGSSGGGGASDVRRGGTALSDRVLVGSGGGGAAYESAWGGGWGVNNGACNGGAGGGLSGNKGGYWQGACQGGDGGTQSSGGAYGGAFGVGGPAKPGDGDTGGGGGGWYGGGGGGSCTGYNGCGGGGSSYVGGVSNGTTLGGQQSGHGKVVISW